MRNSLIHGSLPGRKRTPRRRSIRLDVFQLEDRTLMSTALAPRTSHDAFLAATARVKESRPAIRANSPPHQLVRPLPSIPPLARLGYYLTTNIDHEKNFVPHFVQLDQEPYFSAVDAKLQNPDTDVYVLVHGYAPGFETWVRNYAFGVPGNPKLPGTGQILDWWQTIPANYYKGKSNPEYKQIEKYNTDDAGAESPWLLDGYTAQATRVSSPVLVSANGLAPDLVASDPNAVVLAYSWLDDSATNNFSKPIDGVKIPEDAYKSEARTTLNGERLAMALEQVLPSDFGGKLQLIGHSHGSKVATVAAVALTHADPKPITVNQLTILDSPESDAGDFGYTGALLAEIGATNDNWFFLSNLNISKTPSPATPTSPPSTFVDNYISALDEAYTQISYPGSSSELENVVDVNLRDFPDFIANPANVHSYAAYWYAGSSEGSTTTNGYQSGRMWSPLLPGNTGDNKPPQNLYFNYYTQSPVWPADNAQYYLRFTIGLPNNPVFDPVDLTTISKTPGASKTNNSVTLTQEDKSSSQSYIGSFQTAHKWSAGLTFNYNFTNYVQGDMLNIYDKTPGGQYELAFVIDPNQVPAQTDALQGTISLGSRSIATYDLKFALTSTTPNSTSSVTVSNLMQYANPGTKVSSSDLGKRRSFPEIIQGSTESSM
jgi:hypothetical protein